MKLPRLFWWQIATVLLLAVIGFMHPQQLPVSLYKLTLITMAGVVGYWLDRSIFPYARPDSFIGRQDRRIVFDGDGFVFALAMLRRAILIGCAMLAIGMGA